MPQQQPEVVIVAADGTEHVFPPGFDPKRAAEIVRKQNAPQHRHGNEGFGEFSVLKDVAIGAGKELLRQGERGGAFLRRHVPGLNALDTALSVPDWPLLRGTQSVDLHQTTPEQQFGGLALNTVEFMAPGMRAEKAIARALKAAPRVVRGLTQMTAQAGIAAPVAALQGADPKTAAAVAFVAPPVVAGSTALLKGAGRATVGAIQGAKEGGLGGAMTGAFRAAAITMPPKSMIVRALKPRNTMFRFDESLDRALPEIAATEPYLGKPIRSIDDLLEAVKIAKQRAWTAYERLTPKGAQIDLAPVADAQIRAIPKTLHVENPKAVEAMVEKANQYRRIVSIDEAETLLREANAEIDAYFAQTPHGSRDLLLKNPKMARVVARAKALREVIFDETGVPKTARELKRLYGALLDVENAAFRHRNVAARQAPNSLGEQVGVVRAAGQFAKGGWRLLHGDPAGMADVASAYAQRDMSRFLKEQGQADNLIKRAFEALRGGKPVPARPNPAGLLPERTALITPPPADPSYARGVPAQYPARDPRPVRGYLGTGTMPAPPSRQLPAPNPPVNILPPTAKEPFTGPGPTVSDAEAYGMRLSPGRAAIKTPIITPEPQKLLPAQTQTTPRRYPQSDINANAPKGPFNLRGPAMNAEQLRRRAVAREQVDQALRTIEKNLGRSQMKVRLAIRRLNALPKDAVKEALAEHPELGQLLSPSPK